MNRPKPIVGQTLYSLNVGNAARHTEQKLTEVKVLKVGHTYFHCGINPEQARSHTRYRLSDWIQDEGDDYSGYSEVYASRQEWEDKRETEVLTSDIKKTFDSWTGTKLPLAALRQIATIISDNTLSSS